MNDALLRLILIFISIITCTSGLAQLFAGEFVLSQIATSQTPSEIHLFQTVGMFMVITGAMFLQSLLSRSNELAIPLWIAVQKFAAAILVFIAWQKGFFVAMALGVAAFDGVTGLLSIIFWKRLPR
ncbi:MAG: hypothetical protein ACNYZG_01340 [Gammaproteobacteria bacterium]